jgi:hypothetical protein
MLFSKLLHEDVSIIFCGTNFLYDTNKRLLLFTLLTHPPLGEDVSVLE